VNGKSVAASGSGVRVPSGLYYQSRFFAATRGLWKRLADLESNVVREETEQLKVDRPVYVTALPRSGTTILTEMLERHPDLTCHRYSDFPNVWTPYWRNYLLEKTRKQAPKMEERAHKDRIQVSNDSPEAVEEVLWMSFFPPLHDAGVDNVLDGEVLNSKFDSFYREHILKLLAVRQANRYLAKGNYNVSRIRYILTLFPEAKFLIPVRDPVDHVASLAKQHALFTLASREDPKVPLQLAMSGHFEFGPRRIPVNFGQPQANQAIIDCWQHGREAEGWARYWAETYQFILEQMEEYPEVRKACLLFRYEDLCVHSARLIDTILDHCELPAEKFESIRSEYVDRLAPPDYYRPDFNPEELRQIALHCDPVDETLSKFCQIPV
jgi:hypothetical protein